ncbi:MAG: serpin family protein [Myxococcota bacterium]
MLSRALHFVLPLTLLAGCSSTQGPSPQTSGSPSETPPTPTGDKPTDAPMPAPTPVSDEDLAAAGKSINAFGFDLYRKVATGSDNLIVSPASIAIALGMTFQGATGETAAELEQALHVGDAIPTAQWHAAMGGLGTRWMGLQHADGGALPPTEIALANRLFGADSLPFRESFIAASERDYQAPMERLDFTKSDPARLHINDWVEKQTRTRIKDLLPPGAIKSDTLLVLANAIYFKAQWATPFEAQGTSDAPFFVGGTEKASVPTMRKTGYFAHDRTDDAQVLQLPYAGGPFAMTIVMPTTRDGLGALEAKLSAETTQAWWGELQSSRIAVSMPKFKLAPSKSLELAPALKSLGVTKAFTNAAEFEGMAPPEVERLRIDEVFHKGFIEVDESGTEAAAATAVVMARAGAAPGADPETFTIDRPFLFFIRDTSTDTTVFMGRVNDPR